MTEDEPRRLYVSVHACDHETLWGLLFQVLQELENGAIRGRGVADRGSYRFSLVSEAQEEAECHAVLEAEEDRGPVE